MREVAKNDDRIAPEAIRLAAQNSKGKSANNFTDANQNARQANEPLGTCIRVDEATCIANCCAVYDAEESQLNSSVTGGDHKEKHLSCEEQAKGLS